MGMLMVAICTLASFHNDANPALPAQHLYNSAPLRDKQIVRILGKVPAIAAPLHGGANEAVLKMLSEIGTIENIPEFIEGVKSRKRKMSGFGHRVYKKYDPRAKIIRGLADDVFSIVGRDPLIEVGVALEKTALSDEYFVSRKLYPNVDFYSGLIYRALGFPTEYFPVLFAIPRMAGYLAHWKESLADPNTKIMRPQQCVRTQGIGSELTQTFRTVPPRRKQGNLHKFQIQMLTDDDWPELMQCTTLKTDTVVYREFHVY